MTDIIDHYINECKDDHFKGILHLIKSEWQKRTDIKHEHIIAWAQDYSEERWPDSINTSRKADCYNDAFRGFNRCLQRIKDGK